MCQEPTMQAVVQSDVLKHDMGKTSRRRHCHMPSDLTPPPLPLPDPSTAHTNTQTHTHFVRCLRGQARGCQPIDSTAGAGFAGLAAVLIYVCIILQTGSIFVGTLGFFHVLLSFPIAYSVFCLLVPTWTSGHGLQFGVEWFSFLNWLGLFVVLGIGADDIFVFYDAWRQSFTLLPPATELDSRIAWVWRRASTAMFITSATTSAAFLSNSVRETLHRAIHIASARIVAVGARCTM